MQKNLRYIANMLPLLVLLTASYVHAQGAGYLNQPLNSSFSTIPAFIAGFLKALVMIALPIISLFIVYTGFLFVKARGKPTELATAKRAFFYVMIGAVLILAAWLIANLIGNTVSQLLPS
ncbi:hypothetical protein HZC00_00915 [Candidatus Kaiserbacteria bacterium]|nr:hypothetical protein [Candidatus Kaiserbacteria bacterium]